MSSQPDRGETAPPPTESISPDAATPQDAAQESAAEESRRASGIRIGTQRYGVTPPKAVAKPVFPLGSPPAGPRVQHAEDEASPTASEAAATSDEPAAPADAPASPKTHDHGKKRPAKPRRERSFTAEPVTERKYPPPNIRGQLTPDLEMEYLEAVGEKSLDEIIAVQTAGPVAELEPESRHRGQVISVHRDDVFVQIGPRQQGLLSLRNLAETPEPGTFVDVVVARFNAAEGLYDLILPGGAVTIEDWSQVAEGLVVEARITGHNKGGLECEVNHLRGFIPASQTSMYRVEDLSQFVGQHFPCVITEANPEKRRLVLSRRAVMEREKAEAKEKLLAELEPGQVREGTVRSLQDFGAFVDLGGVDGLIHISQLSWDRIKHASEVLELGQKVKVKIQKIDPQSGKVGLAFRDLSENPWENASRDFPARSRVKGTVSRLMEFGAFVRLAAGVEGLVHISELSHKRVFRVTDVLNEGQEVEVLVLSVDPEQQRISLSLKALEAKPSAAKVEEEPVEEEAPAEPPKKRKTPLKGGIGGPPTGEQFGLKW